MKKKIIGILVMTLLIASGFGSASMVKGGDDYLIPPWQHAGWCNIIENNGIAGADCDASGDEYEGYVYGMVWAGPGVGGAKVNAHYYHQNSFPYYEAPCTGRYDIELTYNYWGDFEGHVFIYPVCWAELVTDVKIRFNLYVDSNPPQSYNKEIVLEENSYHEQGDWFKNWDNTVTILFNDIYIEKNTAIVATAQLDINSLGVGATAVTWASGNVELNGKLIQIKITTPNDPPTKPSVSGPSTGKPDESYQFSAVSTDPNGDQIQYTFDWDDGSSSDWSDFKSSGSMVYMSHAYGDPGTYTIKVLARDIDQMESENYGTHTIVIEEDITPPYVEITRPDGGIYIFDNLFMPLGSINVIIGKITIKVDASDESGIDRVEFYIDNVKENTDYSAPYEWTWTDAYMFKNMEIKAVAYDNVGNSDSDGIMVWKFF